MAAEVLRSDVQSRQWRQQLGPCLTQSGVSVLLGISPQAVAKRAASGSLLRLTNADGRPAYPVGQFQGNRVLDGLPKVLEVLSAVDDELTIASWLTVPKPGLDGRSPLASLHDGDVDQVIEAADDYAARSA
ncbi:hypothetical protein [Iamia sp.]|uniref:hypothetical protein n=1 Tax=Iamia sp. TaxID=2722710 RepID=UPI002CFB6F1F|nr:hypothetical protein [Iamia sp.]HXH56832.1 hypothetical protein [Iamia sp.]